MLYWKNPDFFFVILAYMICQFCYHTDQGHFLKTFCWFSYQPLVTLVSMHESLYNFGYFNKNSKIDVIYTYISVKPVKPDIAAVDIMKRINHVMVWSK